MHYPVPVFVINPSNFDWISFLLGGALGSFFGALIILGIERWWDRRVEKNKFIQEKKQVSNALEIEIGSNIAICDTAISGLATAHHSVFALKGFEIRWLEKYCITYIDFASEDSLRLYSLLYGAKTLMEKFDQIQKIQHGLHVSGRALMSFSDLAYNNNQAMLKTAKELKSILLAIKNLRKDNYVLLDDVKNYPGIHINEDGSII